MWLALFTSCIIGCIIGVYGEPVVFSSGTGGNNSRSFLENLVLDTADEALRAAINNKNVGDAVLGSVLGAVSTAVGESINSEITTQSPNQGIGG